MKPVAKYLQRPCPRCGGYLGIVVPERKAKIPVQAINGRVFGMLLSAGVGIDSTISMPHRSSTAAM